MPTRLILSWRPRTIRAGLWVVACGGFAVHSLSAKPPQTDRGDNTPVIVNGKRQLVIGGKPAPTPCVTADIAGHRTAATDCAAWKLEDAARAAQARAQADPNLGAPDARSAAPRVGIGSLTASSQRLGADLRGRTTLPVRPVPPPSVAPFARKP